MEGLEANLGEGVPLGRHNSAISRCRFQRALDVRRIPRETEQSP